MSKEKIKEIKEETSELSSAEVAKKQGSPFIKTLRLGFFKICQILIKGLIAFSKTMEDKVLPKIEETIKKEETQ